MPHRIVIRALPAEGAGPRMLTREQYAADLFRTAVPAHALTGRRTAVGTSLEGGKSSGANSLKRPRHMGRVTHIP